jgi:lipoyl(octanoyl) transferase
MMDMEQWRLIVDPPRDGAMNMAIDEAILEAVGQGDAPPTLRLFAWEPACLSLGYAQAATDVDSERLAAHGWQMVRRLTGGRAILHTDELTYSIALPLAHRLMAGSIVDSYRRLSAALIGTLERVGLEARADKRSDPSNKGGVGPVCFEVPSDYEITANSKKLVGSAQVRRQNAALQHGTLPLYGDVSRICEVLAFPDDAVREMARERVLERATTLVDALGCVVTWEEAAQAMTEACEVTFSIALDETTLTSAEIDCADELHATRYATDEWNRRR